MFLNGNASPNFHLGNQARASNGRPPPLGHFIVVRPEALAGEVGLWLGGFGERHLRRHRKWQSVFFIFAVAGDIAVQFEVASIRLQLRTERADVACGAGLAGLNRKGGQRERRLRAQRAGQQQQDPQSRATACQPNAHGERDFSVQSENRFERPL